MSKCQKCHGGLSASINIKGDLAELVDGFLLALVNDVQTMRLGEIPSKNHLHVNES